MSRTIGVVGWQPGMFAFMQGSYVRIVSAAEGWARVEAYVPTGWVEIAGQHLVESLVPWSGPEVPQQGTDQPCPHGVQDGAPCRPCEVDEWPS